MKSGVKYYVALLCFVIASGCTEDGLIHPVALATAGAAGAANNPNFDTEAFLRAGTDYYGGL